MKDILSRDAASILDLIACERMLLVFDFDGTLAPIVDRPALAAVPASTRALMRIASLAYPCAVVSGRARGDLAPRLAGLPLVGIVGNHGAEAGHGPVYRSVRRCIEEWIGVLYARLSGCAGVEVEDKVFSIAVHYRAAASRAAARRAVRAATETLAGARVFEGRAVANVVPAGSHDKGVAVAELLRRANRRRALYVGDDRTDETAFRSEPVAVGVRIGRTHRSAATYYLRSQRNVDELLRALLCAQRRVYGLDERLVGLDEFIAMDR